MTATVPFQVLSALIFTFTIYGMAGLRPGINYVVQNGVVCSLMYLIAVQVRCPKGALWRVEGLPALCMLWRQCACDSARSMQLRSGGSCCREASRHWALEPRPPSAQVPAPDPTPGRPPQVLHCCAVLAPNQDTAFMYSIAWSTVQLLMSNFFITFNDLRFKWLMFLRWFSALYYSFEALSIVEFGGGHFDCSKGVDPASVTFLKQLMPNSKFLGLKAVTNALVNPGPDCVADTDALLEYYNFQRPFKITVAIMTGYYIITHVCTYCAMLSVARKERR